MHVDKNIKNLHMLTEWANSIESFEFSTRLKKCVQ